MQPSPRTIGMLMIGLATVMPAMALQSGRPVLTLLSGWAIVPLAIGGAAMFVRHRLSFGVAMSGAALVAAGGAVGLVLRREVGLPITPSVALMVGLYSCFRIAMARGSLASPPQVRRYVADDLPQPAGPARSESDPTTARANATAAPVDPTKPTP